MKRTRSKEIRRSWRNYCHSAMDGDKAVFVYTGREDVPWTVVRVHVRSVDSIPAREFKKCARLRTVELPEGIRIIGERAFQGCQCLEGIKVPSSTVDIGNWAFSYCIKLKSANLPRGIRAIGQYTFQKCKSLESIKVPPSVAVIAVGAFSYCRNLKSVNLPEGLRDIGSCAFDCCYSLETIKVPSSVTAIGDGAFSNCRSLSSVQLLEGIQMIGVGAFYHCHSLEGIQLPSSISDIGGNAFGDCSNLTSVLLPGGLRKIGWEAFERCPLLQNFRFGCFSRRMEGISFDRQTAVEVETKIAQISASVKRGGESWTEGRDGLEQLRGLITYWELKEATMILELALWKAKLETEGGDMDQNEGKGNAKQQEKGQIQEWEQDIGPKEEQKEDSKGTVRLSRKECLVKCGADTVMKEVISYFSYNRGWW